MPSRRSPGRRRGSSARRSKRPLDASGRLRIVNLPANQYVLLIRRIGYAQLSSPVRVTESDTVRAVTQAEIEKVNVAGTLDLLRTFSAFNGGEKSSRGCARTVRLSVFPGWAAPSPIRKLEVGSASARPTRGNRIVRQHVRRSRCNTRHSAATAAVRYGGGFCGVILLWTRSGE